MGHTVLQIHNFGVQKQSLAEDVEMMAMKAAIKLGI